MRRGRASPEVAVLRRGARTALSVLAAAVVALGARSASAQEDVGDDPARVREGDPLRAQQLFDEAIALLDAGRSDEACPKFRESLAAEPAVGTLLNVAACSEREGRALEAARSYRRVLELNAKTTDDARRRAVDVQAHHALEGLKQKLSRLVVKVTPADASARIFLDGNAAENVRAGDVVEVVAGSHAVHVEAPGYRTVDRKLDARGGTEAVVTIALVSSAPPSPLPGPATGPASAHRASPLAVAGWSTGLAGAGVAALGSVLVALASDRASEIRAVCGPDAAPPSCPRGDATRANDLASEGQALSIGGTVALGLGGAALATGITLVIVDAASGEPAPVELRAKGGPGVAFVTVTRRF